MRVQLFTLLVFAIACRGNPPAGAGSSPGPTAAGDSNPTGIEGTASRGPTRPICQVDKPCAAPLVANFEVWQGDRVVARFRSDGAGHFEVRLPPGNYQVRPDASAGKVARSQAHDVIVQPKGFTHVDLHFDTGAV